MGIVIHGGDVAAGDAITVELPSPANQDSDVLAVADAVLDAH
jgi:MOSC domain-containing protein YiiM